MNDSVFLDTNGLIALLNADDSPKTTLVRIDQDFFGRALAIYSATQDKAWGLVDCASFEVMTQHGVRDALTSDRHFAQAGFNCLLADG